jgi:hypothetical protein
MESEAIMSRWRDFDWEAAAGIVAAVAAFVLHLLGIADQEVLLSVILVILALFMLRDLRREQRDERLAGEMPQVLAALEKVRLAVTPADAILVGPADLRRESERFAQRAQGDMVWFNVCLLMFEPQALFDVLLRPAIENPRVRSIQFVLDDGERERWERSVVPKAAVCRGHEKLLVPRWTTLRESVSFILTDTDDEGRTEAHLSFWGEPFMSESATQRVPRYIFHVQPHSELIGRLRELERGYHFRT